MLVILLHAYRHTRRNMANLQQMVIEEKSDTDILVPDLPLSLLSFVSSDSITTELLSTLDTHWRKKEMAKGKYQSVTIEVHSTGALIARKSYVCPCGENDQAPLRVSAIDNEARNFYAINKSCQQMTP